MICKISIIRNDNTHSISLFKKIFKRLSNYDNDNHIDIHLKPRTMIAEIDITCKDLNYYLSILNQLFKYSENEEITAIMDSLLYVIQNDETRYSTEYDDFTIIFKLKSNEYINTWTIFSTNVYIHKYDKSSKPIAEGYVMYNYDDHDFEIYTWKDDRDILKYIPEELLYKIVLLYNYDGKSNIFFSNNNEVYIACCTDHNSRNWSRLKKREEE